jgi:pimeloyl-ACP methyl ester carboxylesterase
MLSLLSYRLKRLNRSVRAKLSLLAPRLDALRASAPLLKLEYAGRKENRTLIIFLPGIDDVAEDFERRGFIHELRREGVAADAIAVDAHYGYYARRVIFERITDDVIASAHAAGYEHIWLVGASLGGFGAASYAARHVSHVSGVLLLAPYLGDKALIDEIADAGGLSRWDPGHVAESDFQRRLWAWFKHRFSEAGPALPIYIGYGAGDMFARANALLADALPNDRVFAIPGRHDWHTWKKIWRMFLVDWVKQRR